MPVATSSMYNDVIERRKRTRALWSDFQIGATKVRRTMDQERNMALQAARSAAPKGHLQEPQRLHIVKEYEKKYFLTMREEWDKLLHDNKLEHEDWGEVTPQELSRICTILGPENLDEESYSPEVEDVPFMSLSRPPAEPVPGPQPLSQSISHQSQSSISSQYSFSSANASYGAPSMFSRSQNTSSAGYDRIDPRNFTDDERNENFSQSHGRYGSDSAYDDGVLVQSYETWDHQPVSAHLANRGFTNHDSPAAYPVSRSHHHQLSSSLSSSLQFPPHASSSFPNSMPAEFHDDDADRLFMPAPSHATAAPSISTAAGSASASATAAKPKSKLRSEYIGPQLTINDSENEADADFASMSKADQVAAYEKFKWDVRVQKIREFHNEAAEIDIELASRIDQVSHDKAATAHMISQHAHEMSGLQQRKEEERKKMVDEERSRMKAEIRKTQPGGSGKSQKKKKGAATTSTTKDTPTRKTSPPTFPASSPYNARNTQTPPISATKLKMPGKSSPAVTGPGPMNLDGLQSVFDSVPDVGLDTAFQISQLLQGSGDVPEHPTSYDSDWNTPQPNPARPNFPSTSNLGARKRTESISVLGGSDSRFGTLTAKKARQRGATVTVAAPGEADHTPGMFWKPQAQQSSPEDSRLATDQYAQFFFDEEVPANSMNMTTSASSGAGVHQYDDENDWVGWNQQSAPKATGVGKAQATGGSSASAWTTKKPSHTVPGPPGSSSPSMGNPGGWGASVKKTLGFGGGNGTTGGGGRGQWETWGQGDHTSEEFAMVEEGGEREGPVRRSPPVVHKKPSILSDMMAKGRNAVAGAVGAALGPMGMNGSSPTMPSQQFPSKPPRKNSSASVAAPPPPQASSNNNMPTTVAGKKAAKKATQAVNKKGTPIALANQEEETYEHSSMQPHLSTPRAAASSTKFTSSFGSPNSNTSSSTQFGFGSPTSRSGVPTGGMWDDTISTTPRPNIISGTFGGRPGNVRKPSGLHQQVWKADEDEEEQEQDQEEDEGEEEGEEEVEEEEEEAAQDEWNMPGSLNPRGVNRPGASGSNPRTAWGAPTTTATGKKATAQNVNNRSAWGRTSTTSSAAQSAPFASTTGPKKGLRQPAHTRVTMEEVPDEAEDKGERSPSDFLAVDSRYVMEPKPSKPAAAFDDIIHFGESSSPEDTRHRPTAMNKRSPPSKRGINGAQDDDFYDQEWYQRAARQLQQETEKGTRLFGEPPVHGGSKSTQSQQMNGGMNIPGHGGSGPRTNNNNPWGTGSSIPAHVAGSNPGSYNASSPLANGPPPKLSSAFGHNTGAPRLSSSPAWGAGKSSSQNAGVGVGLGKAFNAKAKPTVGTSAGFGTGVGSAWGGATATMSGGGGSGAFSHAEDDPWGQSSEQAGNFWEEQKTEEDQEREQELIKSRRKLQEMFDNPGPNSKPGTKPAAKGMGGAAAAARQKMIQEREERERLQREERERELQEQEAQRQEERDQLWREEQEMELQERETQEREEREAREREEQEKAAQEAKAKAAAATKSPPQPKATGGKKGKGKKK